jgi:hypothetical protein
MTQHDSIRSTRLAHFECVTHFSFVHCSPCVSLSLSLSLSLSRSVSLVLIDTPGQIEIFTWSASGTIISESLASTYPSIILYVVDTPRTTSPVTFMSNMMYACE